MQQIIVVCSKSGNLVATFGDKHEASTKLGINGKPNVNTTYRSAVDGSLIEILFI